MDQQRLPKVDPTTTNNDYGKRYLPQVLDKIAVTNPNRLYAAIPRSNELADGFEDISFKDMARCVDYFAHLLKSALICRTDLETVAYLGVPDLRTVVALLAAIKCGYKVSSTTVFHWYDLTGTSSYFCRLETSCQQTLR